MLTVKAYAKINLAIDVLFKRDDGYHEVAMIMQTIDLADTLEIREQEGNITVQTDVSALACDHTNLAYRAAALLRKTFSIQKGVYIMLKKKIPMAAGLAGGSADAAGVLSGLNRLWGLGLTIDQLARLGAKLGSDVPFCLRGGTMLATGRGETLTRLPNMPPCSLILAKPPIDVSTAWVYQNYCAKDAKRHPDIKGMIGCIERQDVAGVACRLHNVLESVTIPRYPQIGQLKNLMDELGCRASLMSGSGPTVFGLADSAHHAENVVNRLRSQSTAEIIAANTVSKVGESIGTEIITN